ncbi:hypothetical protein AHFPHNDE_02067 [Pseudomonas sp. MM227]|uniref:DUF1810 domain-containing protein n=1 Tax=Pseudomonas sp. MM227 TaxID=3019968 RepID=UPI000F02BC59|nr:DUF1810 domain-containing protein [Pseudomonas sp. MM227]CAI3788391.1 hypothetical protein AHFPHNDE_02067 [Pseudomonas sp. MM227]
MNDTFDLNRFIDAQRVVYSDVLEELRSGRKRTHWMWFVFPQLAGLGRSETARFYAISGAAEAVAYLHDPLLGARLLECTRTVLEHSGKSVTAMFGSPDDMKLRSCMTLFASVAPEQVCFQQLLNRFFNGEPDEKTVALLEQPL